MGGWDSKRLSKLPEVMQGACVRPTNWAQVPWVLSQFITTGLVFLSGSTLLPRTLSPEPFSCPEFSLFFLNWRNIFLERLLQYLMSSSLLMDSSANKHALWLKDVLWLYYSASNCKHSPSLPYASFYHNYVLCMLGDLFLMIMYFMCVSDKYQDHKSAWTVLPHRMETAYNRFVCFSLWDHKCLVSDFFSSVFSLSWLY